MNYILVDFQIERFYPLCLTRPISHLRVGMLSLIEKWNKHLPKQNWSSMSSEHFSLAFPLVIQSDNVLIDSTIVPDAPLVKAIQGLLHNEALVHAGRLLAFRTDGSEVQEMGRINQFEDLVNSSSKVIIYQGKVDHLEALTDLFARNDQWIRDDFELLTKGKKTHEIDSHNTVLGEQLFVKSGVKVSASILNTLTGPIFIDKGAEIMEGCMLRGPLYIGKGAQIKMGTKIYGPTSIGPECRVGGEVSNSVMQGYSNKGHDGFMGNSVIGEWCNLGADTNTSNLKNNYSEVALWDWKQGKLRPSGLQFCGLLMGDHSKSAINTQFNTGTSVGVMANVFAPGFPSKYIPSFSWLGSEQNEIFMLDKALILAEKVMERRHVKLTEGDKHILKYLFEQRQAELTK